VSGERAKRIVKEHFFNENEFYGEYMMPSIARNDPAYSEQNYWRGCIWAPMNFLAYLALRNHNLTEACNVLAEKSKNLLLLDWNINGHVHENYHCDTGMGCDSKYSDKFYHWGALLSLIAMIDKGYVAAPEEPLNKRRKKDPSTAAAVPLPFQGRQGKRCQASPERGGGTKCRRG